MQFALLALFVAGAAANYGYSQPPPAIRVESYGQQQAPAAPTMSSYSNAQSAPAAYGGAQSAPAASSYGHSSGSSSVRVVPITRYNHEIRGSEHSALK